MSQLEPPTYHPELTHPYGQVSTLAKVRRKGGRWEAAWSPRNACFSHIDWEHTSAIKYLCNVAEGLEQKHVEFYVRFLREWLTTLPWTVELVYCKDSESNVNKQHPGLCALWTISRTSGREPRDLLYLSAFRYISAEFPNMVSTLYKASKRARTPEALFRTFQQIHLNSAKRTRDDTAYNAPVYIGYGGHSLIWPASRYGNSADEPITLERFAERLKSRQVDSVHAHFR